MRLSMKTDYALRVLFTLVEHHGRGPIPIRELARRNEVPKKFLEQIMLDMKREGWVDSLPGKNGGYRLVKSPEKLSMGRIVRHLEGVTGPTACVSVTDYRRCTQEPVCRFRRVMLEIRNLSARLMDRATLAAVFAGAPVSDREVFAPDFVDGSGI